MFARTTDTARTQRTRHGRAPSPTRHDRRRTQGPRAHAKGGLRCRHERQHRPSATTASDEGERAARARDRVGASHSSGEAYAWRVKQLRRRQPLRSSRRRRSTARITGSLLRCAPADARTSLPSSRSMCESSAKPAPFAPARAAGVPHLDGLQLPRSEIAPTATSAGARASRSRGRGQRQSAEEVSDRIEFARDSCLAPADADVQGACQNSRANSVRCARLHSRKEAPVHGTVDELLSTTSSSAPRTGAAPWSRQPPSP